MAIEFATEAYIISKQILFPRISIYHNYCPTYGEELYKQGTARLRCVLDFTGLALGDQYFPVPQKLQVRSEAGSGGCPWLTLFGRYPKPKPRWQASATSCENSSPSYSANKTVCQKCFFFCVCLFWKHDLTIYRPITGPSDLYTVLLFSIRHEDS